MTEPLMARSPRARELGPPEPVVFPLLPLVYLAWADGVLDEGELAAMRRRVADTPWIDPASTAWLDAWLDPKHPPTADDLRALRRSIATLAAGRSGGGRHSLSRLGLELELGAASGEPLVWDSDEARRALNQLWQDLGLDEGAALEALAVPIAREEAAAPAPAWPVEAAALRAALDGSRAAIRDRIRALLAEPGYQTPPDISRAEYRAWTLDRVQALADEGIGALGYPREAGGGGDLAGFMAAFEMLAIGDLSVTIKFGVQFGLFGGSVLRLGTAAQQAGHLPAIGTLALPGCFAMTELGHGSNVRDVRTVARWDPARQLFEVHTPDLSARKEWIGNAALHGQMATVFAQLEVDGEQHGVHALLVPLRSGSGELLPGVHVADSGRKIGLEGIDNGQVWFDHVTVPRDHLLGRFASVDAEGRYDSPIASPGRRFFTMLGTLVGGRVSVAATALTATKKGLAIAVRYGAHRRQFGPAEAAEVPILTYRTHQRKLLPPVAAAYALDAACAWLTRRYVAMTEDDAREVEALAAGIKAWGTSFAATTLRTCREACGGEGYRWENGLGALRADTDVFTTFEGDNTVLLQLVAKSLLTEFRSQFSEQRVLRFAAYLAKQAAIRVTELNPVTTRLTDEKHLRDPEFQAAAFRYRESRLTRSVSRRLQELLRDDPDGFEAMNAVQDHLVLLARAHVERVINEQFRAHVMLQPDGPTRDTLEALADLFALERLAADRGWFLEAGYIEGSKARAIRSLVNQLCARLATVAIPLVDGFGIPEACLGAPIATGNTAATNFGTLRRE